MGISLGIGKLIYGTLRIIGVVVNDLCLSVQMREFLVENFIYLFCMMMVSCKDDCLANLLTIINFDCILHYNTQGLSYGVLIEYPFVQSSCINAVRQLAIFINEGVFIFFLLITRKIIVGNALLHKIQSNVDNLVVHKITIKHRLCQVITVGRHTIFKLKNVVGVFVNLFFGSCSQSNNGRIKVFKYRLILVVN